MFTIEQIKTAHLKVKSGADFPNYIKEIKQLGVTAFETYVFDSHTVYFGNDNFQTYSKPQYEYLTVVNESNKAQFIHYLKIHQQGKTDYYTFCKHCAETGIAKWIMRMDKMTCTYYDKAGNEVLVEKIPTS